MTQLYAKDLSHHLSIEAKSRTAEQIKAAFKHFKDPNIVSLGGGLPTPDLFPFNSIEVSSLAPPFKNGIDVLPQGDEDLLKITIDKYTHPDSTDLPLSVSLQYGPSFGHPQIIQFIKEHNKIIHNPKYEDWDVILSVGNTQAWDATLRTFTNRGDTILAEQFTFSSSAECARAHGLTVAPVLTDLEGIIPEALDKQLENWEGPMPKLLYTIPTGQNPTGGTLSEERRRAVYKLAQKYDFIIVEDEPYYFLQMDEYVEKSDRTPDNLDKHSFIKTLVSSYISLDTEGRVVRLDSFSKVLAPGARLGWIVGQKNLLEKYLKQHDVTIQIASGFAQSIVNGLLQRWGQEGYLNWLLELRRTYTNKRNAALDAVEAYVPKEIAEWIPPTAGMFFWIKIDASKHADFVSKYDSDPEKLELDIYQAGIDHGVLMIPGHWFLVKEKNHPKGTSMFFRGTFASVTEDKLQVGLKLFGEVLRKQFNL
ncbi:hypothetical protein DV495_004773 [Geotrichum candidum]|nr:hypothetical protein DV452_004039 [Geotrichum candidum]KAF5119427.1 hypothetical protein DV495_004773 [Geotrichum candidum]KAI9210522.1 hypothetical protein DS838_004602 [Geotrichum bryndzae]